jgi:hypothetical protein
MMDQHDRVEQFKAEIADMGLRDPATGRERLLLRLGAVLLVAGPVIAVAAYIQDKSTSGTGLALTQGDDQILALMGVGIAVLGLGLFLRYSLANFLRFWLARLSYEQLAQTDRLLAGLASGAIANASPSAGSSAGSSAAGSSATTARATTSATSPGA